MKAKFGELHEKALVLEKLAVIVSLGTKSKTILPDQTEVFEWTASVDGWISQLIVDETTAGKVLIMSVEWADGKRVANYVFVGEKIKVAVRSVATDLFFANVSILLQANAPAPT